MAVFWIALLRVLGDVRFMISLADMEKTHVFPWCILDILATNSRKEKLALGLYPTKNYLFWHYMIILSYAVVVPDNRDPGNPIVNDPHDPSNMVPLYGHFVLSNLPPNEGVIFPRFFAPFLPSPGLPCSGDLHQRPGDHASHHHAGGHCSSNHHQCTHYNDGTH